MCYIVSELYLSNTVKKEVIEEVRKYQPITFQNYKLYPEFFLKEIGIYGIQKGRELKRDKN